MRQRIHNTCGGKGGTSKSILGKRPNKSTQNKPRIRKCIKQCRLRTRLDAAGSMGSEYVWKRRYAVFHLIRAVCLVITAPMSLSSQHYPEVNGKGKREREKEPRDLNRTRSTINFHCSLCRLTMCSA